MRILDPSGQYRISVTTGVVAAAPAGAQLFQFKWTPAAPAAGVAPTNLAIILKARARILPLTPFTAGTLTDASSLDMFNARSFGGGGGGTSLTLTGNNAKMDINMPTSLAAINVATTAALTPATTLDSQPFAQSLRKANRVNPAAATEEVIVPSIDTLAYEPDLANNEKPRILHPGEGIVIANRSVWPAAGTAIVLFEITWAEANGFT
jgi:hypothetical protein